MYQISNVFQSSIRYKGMLWLKELKAYPVSPVTQSAVLFLGSIRSTNTHEITEITTRDIGTMLFVCVDNTA